MQPKNEACGTEIVESVNFFLDVAFARKAPYTQQEYKDRNYQSVITKLEIQVDSIDSAKDKHFHELSEEYTVQVSGSGAKITAKTIVGLAHAM